MENKSGRLLIAIEPELKAQLEASARDAGVSMSEYVRRLIRCIPLVGTIEGDRVCFGSDNERE